MDLVPACVNHPAVATETRCGRCGRPFCGDCLVEIVGKRLCALCRDWHVRELQQGVETNERAAREALTWSVVGLFCFICAPFGLVKGIKALREVGTQRSGARTMAIVAIVLACLTILLLVGRLVLTLAL